MKKTTFAFAIVLVACLAILYIEANRGSDLAIVVLAVGGTTVLILTGGGLVLAYSYLQSEIADRRYRRREAEQYYREQLAALERAGQLPAGEQPIQTFASTTPDAAWLRE